MLDDFSVDADTDPTFFGGVNVGDATGLSALTGVRPHKLFAACAIKYGICAETSGARDCIDGEHHCPHH